MVEYSEKIFDGICAKIAQGKSLVTICESKEFPSRAAFYKWLDGDQTLVDKYTRAKQECADFYAEEIISIADNCEDPQKARLQIEARKWTAAKLKPRAYGERVDHTSSDGSMTPQTTYNLGKLKSETLRELIAASEQE